MRKERTLRESMQTEIQQQPKGEKTNRRRNKRTEQINKRLRRKHSSHKKNQEDKRKEQTFSATVQINGIKKEFIIDTGSPVS